MSLSSLNDPFNLSSNFMISNPSPSSLLSSSNPSLCYSNNFSIENSTIKTIKDETELINIAKEYDLMVIKRDMIDIAMKSPITTILVK